MLRLTERSLLANMDAVVRWDHGEAMVEMEEGRGALRPAMATAALRRLLLCLLRASAEAREKAGNRMRAREGAGECGAC